MIQQVVKTGFEIVCSIYSKDVSSQFHFTIRFYAQEFVNIKAKIIFRIEELLQATEIKLNMKEEINNNIILQANTQYL